MAYKSSCVGSGFKIVKRNKEKCYEKNYIGNYFGLCNC